ncbi:MAG: class I SAM-dependent methyltransferase [Acidimicrobiia bacterium]|jgi:SAM-dependent methyltransferase
MTTTARRRAYYRLFGADGYLAHATRGARVLDVGCSDGRGSEVLSGVGAAGVDIYRPNLALARDTDRRTTVVQADVRALPYRDGAFDVVVALDVVEHFTKPDALALITELERVAADRVVLATPRGFLPQPGTADEPWQEHRCGFEVDELRSLGYAVHGIGGPARLRGPYGVFVGGVLGQVATAACTPVIRRVPSRAFALLAVKRVTPS